MQRFNPIRAREISNGSRHTHNAPMGSRRQPKLGQRPFQQLLSWHFQSTIPFQESRLQLGIRVNPVVTISEALPITRLKDARTNHGRTFRHMTMTV
jgi:hypothetical protein